MAELRTVNVHKVSVSSVAKIVGVAWALLMLIVALFASFGVVAAILSISSIGILAKVLYSLLAVFVLMVVYPLVNFAFGWLYGAVVALIINVIMHYANGLELEIEDEGAVVAKAVATK